MQHFYYKTRKFTRPFFLDVFLMYLIFIFLYVTSMCQQIYA